MISRKIHWNEHVSRKITKTTSSTSSEWFDWPQWGWFRRPRRRASVFRRRIGRWRRRRRWLAAAAAKYERPTNNYFRNWLHFYWLCYVVHGTKNISGGDGSFKSDCFHQRSAMEALNDRRSAMRIGRKFQLIAINCWLETETLIRIWLAGPSKLLTVLAKLASPFSPDRSISVVMATKKNRGKTDVVTWVAVFAEQRKQEIDTEWKIETQQTADPIIRRTNRFRWKPKKKQTNINNKSFSLGRFDAFHLLTRQNSKGKAQVNDVDPIRSVPRAARTDEKVRRKRKSGPSGSQRLEEFVCLLFFCSFLFCFVFFNRSNDSDGFSNRPGRLVDLLS